MKLSEVRKASLSKILSLKAAGFTSRDIIDAYKAGQLEELFALVEEESEDEGDAARG